MQSLLKSFDKPDEVRRFEKGRFEIVHLPEMTLGRATYEPGWKWSVHVGPGVGEDLCNVEHLGLVLEGRAVVAYEDGETELLTAGTLFYIPGTRPHDSWVEGDQNYVSIHLQGAERYAEADEPTRSAGVSGCCGD